MSKFALLAAPAAVLAWKFINLEAWAPESFFTSTSEPHQCCNMLDSLLPGKVFFPGSLEYKSHQSDYYSSEQISLLPGCRITPTTAQNVSQIVKVASQNQCTFAVKSGGHMAWLGASNIGPSGFTIDLDKMQEVSVSKDKTIVSFASGSKWTEIYKTLMPFNLTTVGGRSAGVGVGGFLSHGGISFLSIGEGFGSDNIVAYEVVLADGSIVHASQLEKADLFWALKLGSTNFGIITRFEMSTFPLGDIWGGLELYDIALGPTLLEDLISLTSDLNKHPFGMAAVGLAYNPETKSYFIWQPKMYYKPVVNPSMFASMSKYEPFLSTMKVRSLADYTEEVLRLAPGVGTGRAQWFSLTIKNDAKLPWDMFLRAKEVMAPMLEKPGAMWALTAQPINALMMKAGSRNGGNPSGMKESDGDLQLLLGTVFWADGKDDEVMSQKTHDLTILFESMARERDLLHPFIYMNYASGSQNVYGGLGEENYGKLKEVKNKYDPDNVFGRYWFGGFKL